MIVGIFVWQAPFANDIALLVFVFSAALEGWIVLNLPIVGRAKFASAAPILVTTGRIPANTAAHREYPRPSLWRHGLARVM